MSVASNDIQPAEHADILATPALAKGKPLVLMEGVSSLVAGLAARVADRPTGLLRSYDIGGAHRAISFAEAWRRAGSIAAALERNGMAGGRQIVLFVEDVVDFVPAFLACMRSGGVAVPLHGAAKTPGLVALRMLLRTLVDPVTLVDGSAARDPGMAALRREYKVRLLSDLLAEEAVPSDREGGALPSCLIPTSGSTGRLKLVAIDHDALMHRFFSTAAAAAPKDVDQLCTFPADSSSGLHSAFLNFRSYTAMSACALTARPDAVLLAVAELGISHLFMTPSMARRLIKAEASIPETLDLSALRFCGLGAEMVGCSTAEQLLAVFKRHGAHVAVRAGYGTTETGALVEGADALARPRDGNESVDVGGCAPGVSLRIVGDDTILGEGAIGEVEVSCPLNMFSGYWNEPEASRLAFTADGWWKTGDLGELVDGRFTFRGRSKHILVVNGRKLSLAEIEAGLVAGVGSPTYTCVLPDDDGTEHLGIVIVAEEPKAAGLIEDVRTACIRRYGLDPRRIIALPSTEIPLTATGKIRRDELAPLIARRAPLPVPRASAPVVAAALEADLTRIWREVLNLGQDFDWHADFFELGGDSLRSVTLHSAIETRLGRQLSPAEFFAAPSFATLLSLVSQASSPAADARPADRPKTWPLPDSLRHAILTYFESWSGERPTEDRLITGLNVRGSQPPLFCLLQDNHELTQLARQLGPDQPVYALRSGYLVDAYSEDDLQLVSLRFVQEILSCRPSGPLFLLGICLGASLAIAIAQHLQRRRRFVPLLILAEVGLIASPYTGPTMLVYGRDSILNPRKSFQDPGRAWRRLLPDHSVTIVPGLYGELCWDGNVEGFAHAVASSMADALNRTPTLMPKADCAIAIEASGVPARMKGGGRAEIVVEISNTGWAILSTEAMGLVVANTWCTERGQTITSLDGKSPLFRLEPNCRVQTILIVKAPSISGRVSLCIDLQEEGQSWFGAPWRASVEIVLDEEIFDLNDPRSQNAAAKHLLAKQKPEKFDAEYYLLNNRDLLAAGVDPFRHFMEHGWYEGRDPSALFSIKNYLKANPQVAAARTNPLIHFWATGADGWQR